jgi:hypothetical protein
MIATTLHISTQNLALDENFLLEFGLSPQAAAIAKKALT